MSLTTINARENFVDTATETITALIREAIAERGSCVLALSGGSTPVPVYEALAVLSNIDWGNVFIVLVDERYVPANDPESNQGMIRAAFASAGIPNKHTHAPDTTRPLDECIAGYGTEVKEFLMTHPIDIAILGMGPDGHIASLFPPVPDAAFDADTAVIHTQTDQFAVHDRISLTLPVLQTARHAVFLLKGEEKKRVWEEMMGSTDNEKRWPAKAIIDAVEATIMFGYEK